MSLPISSTSGSSQVVALLTCTPFVGDLIAIAMGLLRINPWATAALMFVGKFARYLVVAGVVNMVS